MTTTAVRSLLALPGSERLDGLETLIVAEFRAALQLEPDEPLAVNVPYFELGLTSLRITEAKGRLERLLGVSISSNVLFNRPTVAQLTAYLAQEALPELFGPPRRAAEPDPRSGAETDERALLDRFLPELGQSREAV